MSGEIHVQQVVFDDSGMVVAYQDLDDIRVEGAVVMQRQLRIEAGHPDYGEDITKIHDRVVRALKNALEDFETSEPYRFEDEDDHDDEGGMGE